MMQNVITQSVQTDRQTDSCLKKNTERKRRENTLNGTIVFILDIHLFNFWHNSVSVSWRTSECKKA